MSTSSLPGLHIAPVGFGPKYKGPKKMKNLVNSQTKMRIQFITGPNPIPALTCADAAGLGILGQHAG
jgi:hypothetical protein